jgi:endonuclease YncB( thermonuclease family)
MRVPLYRPRYRLRHYDHRHRFSSRHATIRLVVLLGILAAIFVKKGLGLDVLWASNWLAVSGGGQFTLCSRSNQAQCVVDGDTIHYAGLKIRLEDIDAPETYQ